MKLKKEQVALYLSNSFNNEAINELVKKSENQDVLISNIIKLSKFLLSYLTATEDLSKENMIKIIKDYTSCHNEINEIEDANKRYGTLDSMSLYFKNHIFPIVVEDYRKRNGIQADMTLKDYVSIYKNMRRTSQSNYFTTHSFPGALYNEISKNGLDISREFFKEEVRFLSQYGFTSPYQTGALYVTNLSYQSVGYALLTPEKILISFSGLTNLKKEGFETTYDYHKKIIETFLIENETMPDIKTAINALNKINDFYFTNDDSCIAVMDSECKYDIDNIYIPSLFTYTLDSCSYQLKELLQIDKYFKNIFDKTNTLLQGNEDEGIEMLDKLMQYVSQKYPDHEETTILRKEIEYDLFSAITHYGLNCFHSANGEGFRIESGIIEPKKISIAKFKNPLSLYSKFKKNNEQLNRTKIIQKLKKMHTLLKEYVNNNKLQSSGKRNSK